MYAHTCCVTKDTNKSKPFDLVLYAIAEDRLTQNARKGEDMFHVRVATLEIMENLEKIAINQRGKQIYHGRANGNDGIPTTTFARKFKSRPNAGRRRQQLKELASLRVRQIVRSHNDQTASALMTCVPTSQLFETHTRKINVESKSQSWIKARQDLVRDTVSLFSLGTNKFNELEDLSPNSKEQFEFPSVSMHMMNHEIVHNENTVIQRIFQDLYVLVTNEIFTIGLANENTLHCTMVRIVHDGIHGFSEKQSEETEGLDSVSFGENRAVPASMTVSFVLKNQESTYQLDPTGSVLSVHLNLRVCMSYEGGPHQSYSVSSLSLVLGEQIVANTTLQQSSAFRRNVSELLGSSFTLTSPNDTWRFPSIVHLRKSSAEVLEDFELQRLKIVLGGKLCAFPQETRNSSDNISIGVVIGVDVINTESTTFDDKYYVTIFQIVESQSLAGLLAQNSGVFSNLQTIATQYVEEHGDADMQKFLAQGPRDSAVIMSTNEFCQHELGLFVKRTKEQIQEFLELAKESNTQTTKKGKRTSATSRSADKGNKEGNDDSTGSNSYLFCMYNIIYMLLLFMFNYYYYYIICPKVTWMHH